MVAPASARIAGAGKPLRLVFCGTPEFAVPTLAALHEAGHALALTLTQPDRPAGRGMELIPSAVKQWALAHALPIAQPDKIRTNADLRVRLQAIAPDAIVVVAYGRILPLWMLELPPLGCINLHGSLLPKYRGAAPIQWAIANGEPVTGITTMLLEEGLDTGPILERRELAVPPGATAAELFPQLGTLGAPLVLSTLAGLANGTLTPKPQDHTQATHAPILTREDGRIHFTRPATEIYNRWRGFQPWPGAWTTLAGKKLTLTRLGKPTHFMAHPPGELFLENNILYAACGQSSAIEILELQLEGKRPTPSADFLRGYPNLAGALLG